MKTNVIIVVAPSGAGKSTFLERVLKEFPVLEDTITCTTRQMRTGESEGHPYHFISKDEFEKLRANGHFVEWAKVHTNYYGTPRQQLDKIIASGKIAIMDVDVQGAKNLKRFYPQAKSIFIMPPSLDILRKRILLRDTKTPDDLDIRLQNAKKEMDQVADFDYCLINDELEKSYKQFKKMIAELITNE